MSLCVAFFSSVFALAEGISAEQWNSSDMETSCSEGEIEEDRMLQRIVMSDPNALCTESIALEYTGNEQILTNLAMVGFILLQSVPVTVEQAWTLGFIDLLKKQRVNPNILMTPPPGDIDSFLDFHHASTPYYQNPGRGLLPNGGPDTGKFSIFTLLCRPMENVLVRLNYDSAKLLFMQKTFDFNKPVWKGVTHAVTLFEAVLYNVGEWDLTFGNKNFNGSPIDTREFGYRRNLNERERDSLKYAAGMLESLAEENGNRIRAREQRVKQCVAMLSVDKRRSVGLNSNQLKQVLSVNILKRDYMAPIQFDAILRDRVVDLISHSCMLKVNKYVQMMVPRDLLQHASFSFGNESDYQRVKKVYIDAGLQDHFVPRAEYENFSK